MPLAGKTFGWENVLSMRNCQRGINLAHSWPPTHKMERNSVILRKYNLVNGNATFNPYLAGLSNILRMQRV